MTYEEWAKEIAAAPMLFDGNSKHVHSRIFADWTAERKITGAERDKLREEVAYMKRELSVRRGLAQEGTINFNTQTVTMSPETRAALEKPYVDPLDGTRAVDAEGNRL